MILFVAGYFENVTHKAGEADTVLPHAHPYTVQNFVKVSVLYNTHLGLVYWVLFVFRVNTSRRDKSSVFVLSWLIT